MDGDPPPEDFSTLHLQDRLTHKNWKARSLAYDELTAIFKAASSEGDPIFQLYTNDTDILKRAITDPIAIAQEKGVECACTYIEHAGRQAAHTRDTILPAIVDKGLGSARSGIRSRSIELCLRYVEVEEKSDGVVLALLGGLSAKQPKTVLGCVSGLKELVRQFGVPVINPKPICKSFPTIFAHPDKNVRAEGTRLTQEIYRFIGSVVEQSLTNLKPVQIKELKDAFSALEANGEGHGQRAPTRFTRSQQRKQQVGEKEVFREVKEERLDEEIRAGSGYSAPSELADPVDVTKRLPQGFYDNIMSSRWQDRKDGALQPLLAVVSVPRIVDSPEIGELVKVLAEKMTDINLFCVTLAAQCIEALAKGLKPDFAKYYGVVAPMILGKCKEKKQGTMDALNAALDAVFLSLSISDIVEDVAAFSRHKNPQVKSEALRWLVRCLQTSNEAPNVDDVGKIADICKNCFEDGFEPVRNAAADGLGTLMKIVGEAALKLRLEDLDSARMKRVQEFCVNAKVQVQTKGSYQADKATSGINTHEAVIKLNQRSISKPASMAKVSAAANVRSVASSGHKTPTKATMVQVSASTISSRATTDSLLPKKTITGPMPSDTASRTQKKTIEPLIFRFTSDEADLQADDVFPTGVLEALASSNWKDRLTAFDDQILPWINAGTAFSSEAEIVVRILAKKPGWKESNFQVWNKMINALQQLAERSPSWTKACSAICIPAFFEKLGDAKLRQAAGDALGVLSEKASLQFVLERAYEPLNKLKAPKALADSLGWIEQALRAFGITGLATRDLIEFLKGCLKHANPAVRMAATKTLVALRIFTGPAIKDLLQDLNQQLLSTIESEFVKVASELAPIPTRSSADVASPAAAASAKLGAKALAHSTNTRDHLEEIFPRVDVDKIVPLPVLAALNDTNWKARKEAMEHVRDRLEANPRLLSSMNDLSTPLKLRLADANKMVQHLALDILSRIARGMGKPFERHIRNFLPTVVSVLADKASATRAQGLLTLSTVYETCGLDHMLAILATALEAPKPELRKELLSWLQPILIKSHDVNLAPMTVPILACLEDRAPDIRKASQALLPAILASVGHKYVFDQASNLKPASRSSVMPLIQAQCAGIPTESINAWNCVATRAANVFAARESQGASEDLPPDSSTTVLEAPFYTSATTFAQTRQPLKECLVNPPKANNQSTTITISNVDFPIKASVANQKTARIARESVSPRWALDGQARPEQLEHLFQQMGPYMSSGILVQLFSKDHRAERDYLTALAEISECIRRAQNIEPDMGVTSNDARERICAIIDLLFRYLSIRLTDNNSTLSNRCLDVVEQLIAMLSAAQINISEYEASCIIPMLITKTGDSRETIRRRVRNILHSLGTVFASSRLFAYLLEYGTASKNAKVRAECVEEMGQLFQRQGLQNFAPSKSLPSIATFISDRDATVRQTALSTMATAYDTLGEELFRHLGKVPQKDLDLLEERLKRSGVLTSPAGRFGTPSRNALMETPRRGGRASLARPRASLRPASPAPISALQIEKTTSSEIPLRVGAPERPTFPPALEAPTDVRVRALTDFEQLCSDMQSADPNDAVDALKAIQKAIANQKVLAMKNVNIIVEAACYQMATAFADLSASTPLPMLRLCKHLMSVLNAVFDSKDLAEKVGRKFLLQLMAELIRRLLDTAEDIESESLQPLSKVLNMVLIRIFHNSDRNVCMGALFSVLQTVTHDLRLLQGEERQERAKYAELVMKCLWKVSKMARASLEDGSLKPDELLSDMNKFLMAITPAEWRRRSADNIPLGDMPLRTVKTILQQVAIVYGASVFQHCKRIDESSFVHAYLQRLLNGPHSGMSNVGRAEDVATSISPPLAETSGNDTDRRLEATFKQVEAEFEEICARIQDPSNSKRGIVELYDFRKYHPELEQRITRWVSNTGLHFQAYVRRTLQNLAVEESRQGQSPSERKDLSRSLVEPEHLTTSSPIRHLPQPMSPNVTSPVPSPSTDHNDEEEARKQRIASLQAFFRKEDS